MSKLITVFGATGAQGGSVVEQLLKEGSWKVRAITRNLDSDKAKALRALGVEVVKGDVNEADLLPFFKDAYAAFVLTNFWDPASMGKEEEQGKKLVEAAHKANVQHFIWSSLPNVKRISKGKYNVPHFSDKALVEEYIIGLQKSSKPAFKYVTFYGPAFYYQNLQSFFPPKKEGDHYVFTLPETSNVSMFDVSDTGIIVSAILKDPVGANGKFIAGCAFHGSPQIIEEEIRRASGLGDKIKINLVNRDAFAKLGFPGADELGEMFGWFNEFTYFGNEIDRNSGQQLASLKKFDEWVRHNLKFT